MTNKDSMFNIVHYCVRCNEIANVLDANTFICSVCGQKWQVIDCE